MEDKFQTLINKINDILSDVYNLKQELAEKNEASMEKSTEPLWVLRTVQLVNEGSQIQAIRHLREQFPGLGLRNAKAMVDGLRNAYQ